MPIAPRCQMWRSRQRTAMTAGPEPQALLGEGNVGIGERKSIAQAGLFNAQCKFFHPQRCSPQGSTWGPAYVYRRA